jgi:hypothetical protein
MAASSCCDDGAGLFVVALVQANVLHQLFNGRIGIGEAVPIDCPGKCLDVSTAWMAATCPAAVEGGYRTAVAIDQLSRIHESHSVRWRRASSAGSRAVWPAPACGALVMREVGGSGGWHSPR